MPRFFGKQKGRLIQMNVENKMLIKKINRIQRKSGIESGKLLRATTFEVLNRVIKKTPVQFGRARAGWLPFLQAKGFNVNMKSTSELKAKPKNLVIKPGDVSRGMSEGNFKERLTGTFKRIVILNGVPYILQLEYGSSKQAPGGMVREAMREVASGLDVALKKYARKIRK